MAGTPPVVSDGVVTLRLGRPDDAPRIVEACQDPLIARFTTVPSPYGPQDAEPFLAKASGADLEAWWANPTWVITCPGSGADTYGGGIDLRPDGSGGAEVGYLVAPWLRGRGVATRALRLACRWGFSALGLEVVRWKAHVDNDASRAVAWKVGFHLHGEPMRKALELRGDLVDAWYADLLPGDLADAPRRAAGPGLTTREREVLALLARGLANRAIAEELGISENTVKNHVRRLLEKLQAGSRMEAVAKGARLGLVSLH